MHSIKHVERKNQHSPVEPEPAKLKTCGEKAASAISRLNRMLHISFFFQLMMGFHMNFLMGIFANIRFANLKSGFGIANFILTITTLLFLISLLIFSILK